MVMKNRIRKLQIREVTDKEAEPVSEYIQEKQLWWCEEKYRNPEGSMREIEVEQEMTRTI